MLRTFVVALLVSLTAPAAALADQATAGKLSDTGKDAYAREMWDDAIAAFEAAFEADPKPKYLFNAARAYDRKGDHAGAISTIERYLKLEIANSDRTDGKAFQKMLQIKIVKTRSRVSITSQPPDARFVLTSDDSKVRGKTPWSGWVAFGKYALTVEHKGHESQEQTVYVDKGKTVDLAVKLASKQPKPKPEAKPIAKAKPRPAPGASGAPTGRPESSKPGPLPYVVGGLGAATIAAGVFLGLGADSDLNDRKGTPIDRSEFDALKADAEDTADTANLLVGAGVGLVAAGAALWLFSRPDAGSTAAVTPTPGGATVTLGGRF